MEMSKSTE